ncbi:MAG: hypothetical protein V4793_05415 [Paraburkholderia tropica]
MLNTELSSPQLSPPESPDRQPGAMQLHESCHFAPIFLVMATTAYEGSDPVRASVTSERAQEFAQQCRDYEATYQRSPHLQASDAEWACWEAADKVWAAAHPAAPYSRRESYDVHEIMFTEDR